MHDFHKLDHSLVTNNQFAISVTIHERLETEGGEVRGTKFMGEIRKIEGSEGSQVVPARPSCEGRPIRRQPVGSDEGSVTGGGLLGVYSRGKELSTFDLSFVCRGHYEEILIALGKLHNGDCLSSPSCWVDYK
jgi:hypothetical protein